jgi:hypothetical protein
MEGNLRYQPIIATFNSSAISKVSMCAVLGHRTIPWVVLRVYHDSICSPFLSHNFKFLLLIKSIMYIILLQEYPHKTYMINLISFPFLSSHLFLIQTLSTLQTLHPGAPEPPAWAAHRCRGLSWVHLSCSPYFCILPLIRFLRTFPAPCKLQQIAPWDVSLSPSLFIWKLHYGGGESIQILVAKRMNKLSE